MSNDAMEYTSTSGDLVAGLKGLYALDYVAQAYGSASIDFKIGGNYYSAITMAGQTHEILTIPPGTTYRVSMTGGTGAIVRLTPLERHTA